METWLVSASACGDAGIEADFVQENVSRSLQRNTVRGLHYQVVEPQGRLVRVVEGPVFDVAVDLRRGSPNYLQCVGLEMSATIEALGLEQRHWASRLQQMLAEMRN